VTVSANASHRESVIVGNTFNLLTDVTDDTDSDIDSHTHSHSDTDLSDSISYLVDHIYNLLSQLLR